MSEKGICRKALKAAFPHAIPIFAGFWFLGMTCGIFGSLIRFDAKGLDFVMTAMFVVIFIPCGAWGAGVS